jgi:PKD repeat protein
VTVRASVGADQTAFDSTTASIIGQRDIGLSAGGPYSGRVGQNITMTGSIQDPEARVTQWLWEFGDGTSASGRVVQKGYTATGIFQVTLTAILDDGQSFIATTTASIASSQQITASAGGPYSAAVGQPITMTGSINPAGLAVAEWLWNFGDGTTGSGQTVQKTYSASGTYTVTLQVRPANEGAVTATTTATIGAQAPTEPVRMVTGCNNVALTWQVGTPLMTVVNAVSPPGVTESIFTLDAAQGRFRGYSPTAPSFANDFTMVETALQAVYICVTASSTLNRPVPYAAVGQTATTEAGTRYMSRPLFHSLVQRHSAAALPSLFKKTMPSGGKVNVSD